MNDLSWNVAIAYSANLGRGPLKANFQRSMLSVLCNNCLVVYRWVPISVELAHGSCPAASIFCGASLG